MGVRRCPTSSILLARVHESPFRTSTHTYSRARSVVPPLSTTRRGTSSRKKLLSRRRGATSDRTSLGGGGGDDSGGGGRGRAPQGRACTPQHRPCRPTAFTNAVRDLGPEKLLSRRRGANTSRSCFVQAKRSLGRAAALPMTLPAHCTPGVGRGGLGVKNACVVRKPGKLQNCCVASFAPWTSPTQSPSVRHWARLLTELASVPCAHQPELSSWRRRACEG